MKSIITIIFFILLILCGTADAADTYYIDYGAADNSANGTSSDTPWKVAPGMVGCDANCGTYLHSAGDIFLFKGGVTWDSDALPLTIGNSGTSGNVDTYRVATSAEWTGSTGRAIFDGEATDTVIIDANSVSYIRLSGLDINNVATGDYKGIDIRDGDDVEIDDCRIRPDTWIGIYCWSSTANTYSNFLIHDNDISHCAMGIVVAAGASNVIYDNVQIYGNDLHDFTTELTGTRHGDGIHTWGSGSDTTRVISNLKIYSNYSYGSFARSGGTAAMTAMVYIENCNPGAEIYNNLLTISDSPDAGYNILSNGFIHIQSKQEGCTDGQKVYNNTLIGTYAGGNTAMGSAINNGDYDINFDVKNNIIRGVKICYDFGNVTGATIDYNDANCGGDAIDMAKVVDTFYNWTEWQSAGYEASGINIDPSLDANYKPDASDDPVVNAGADLSGTFTTDKDGYTRIAPWDIGAYEYVAATLTGTLSDNANESDIVTGGQTLIITLTRDTFVATVGADNAITTALIAGIDSAQSEAAGWDAVVKANIVYTDVTRDSDTQVTITLGAEATYSITANETVTVTIPATALTGGVAIIATPTFDILTDLSRMTGGGTGQMTVGGTGTLTVN